MTRSDSDGADGWPRTGPVFVVGSSRSGTTMMSRILGRHPRVHAFNEVHFFDELTAAPDRRQELAPGDQVALMGRLLTIERDGYLHQRDPALYEEEARRILGDDAPESVSRTPSEVYRRFLEHECRRNGADVACEQTPRYVFHVEEIHRLLPGARVVNMVRDPRAVLLSQKNKWKRRFLGGDGVPRAEALRSWINYHPATISQVWRSSVLAAHEVADESWVRSVRFEDVLREPGREVAAICEFAGLEFREDMLAVPQVGSSNAPDRPEERGIDDSRLGSWREGGLSATELWICQKLAGSAARDHGYAPVDSRPTLPGLVGHGASFPLKTGLALAANLGRFSDLPRAVLRRLR